MAGDSTFTNKAAGTGEGYTVSFNTTGLGLFSATYTFALSDQNLNGASAPGSKLLTLTVMGRG